MLLLLPAFSAAGSCPDVRPIEGLDLDEWTRSSWYIAEQQVNGYQSEEDLFCVVVSFESFSPLIYLEVVFFILLQFSFLLLFFCFTFL